MGLRASGSADYGGDYGAVEVATRMSTPRARALICLLISLVAGAFGYTGLARGAAQISKILFFIFLVLFIVILILAISAGQLIF